MKITSQVAEVLARARAESFVTLTTVGPDGWPHTRPMDLVVLDEDEETLLFGSVNPGMTAENLRGDARAEVLVAHRRPSTGYNLEGWAEFIADPNAPDARRLRAIEPDRPVVGVIRFHVERIRVATPLTPETGTWLPGSEARS